MELLLSAARTLGVWAYLLLPLTAVLGYGFYNAWLHPLRQYPGPFLWRAYRLPYVVSIHKGQVHNRLQEFHTKYGPIVRIAPDELSYADSRAWKDIYIPRPGHQLFQKNRTWFKKQAPDEPHSIMSYDEASHSRFRRAFAGAFSDTTLRDQAPIVEGYVNLLISRLRDSASRTVDLEHMFECIAFDIGSDLSFGESFDSLKSGKQHPWVEVAKGFGRGLALIATINKYPPVDRLLRSIMPKKVMEKMRDHAMMSSAMAQKRIAMDIDRPDFVTATKKYVEAKGGVQGREWDINLMIMVFASSETLASALTATIRELVQNPGVLYRLTTELRSTFSSDNEITVASTTHLTYLNAVINEGLRLDPPTVISPPRVVPPGGDKVCDRFVPAGTYVAYNQFAANRQDYNFHLPNTFLPERFLRPYHPDDDMASFQPFHLGRHQCIGLKLAWAEMRVVIARVLYVFDLRLADEKERCDWGDQKSYITWVKRPLNVVIEDVEVIA